MKKRSRKQRKLDAAHARIRVINRELHEAKQRGEDVEDEDVRRRILTDLDAKARYGG